MSDKVPVNAVLPGSAHRLQVRSGRKATHCGSCNRLEVPPEANTPCAVPGERQPLPQKVWSPLANSQFLSLVFLIEALAWVCSDASLCSLELATGVLLRLCRQNLGFRG